MLIGNGVARSLVWNIEPKVKRENEGCVVYSSSFPSEHTVHCSKLEVELHLVATIVDEVGVKEGICGRASKHAVPTLQTLRTYSRLHVIEVPGKHDPSIVVPPITHIHDILPIIHYK